MTKPKVFATRRLFPAAEEILNASCVVEYWTQPERISKEELFGRLKGKEGLVCLLTGISIFVFEGTPDVRCHIDL